MWATLIVPPLTLKITSVGTAAIVSISKRFTCKNVMFLPFQTFSYDHFCLKAVFTFCWFLKTWHFPQDLDNCDQKLFQPLNFGSISELRSHCSNVKYFRITTTISQSYYNPGTEFPIVFLNSRNKTLLKIVTMISYHFWAFSKYS